MRVIHKIQNMNQPCYVKKFDVLRQGMKKAVDVIGHSGVLKTLCAIYI